MLKSYLMVAVRTLLRHRGYSLLNIVGLAIGIACCLLILLYVQYELSYDRFHTNADQIYRVVREERAPGRVTHLAITPAPLAPALRQEFPEVRRVVRLKPPNAAWMLRYEDKSFYETNFYLADSTVFDVFFIPLLKGNPATALQRPFTVVLTETVARKYFGNEEPIGKLIRGEESMDLEVTGVMPSLPPNSHLTFEILASMGTQEQLDRQLNQTYLTRWRSPYNFYTYVLLPPGADPSRLEQKLPALVEKYAGSELHAAGVTMRFSLQPLTAIHLHSHLERELSANSEVTSIYLFSAIAVFILLIACINFMNLATARAAMRAKEVRVRKVVGAQRRQLIVQFLGESLLVSCLAALLAVGMVMLFLPTFNTLAGKAIPRHLATNGTALGGLAGITLVVGLAAGAYPAFVLSAFRPVAVLTRMGQAGRGRSGFRKLLVVVQFTITIALLICTGIVVQQLHYVRNKQLGLNPDQLVIIPMTFTPFAERYPVFKREALQHPAVLGVTRSNFAPGRLNTLGYSLYQSAKAPMTESVEMCSVGADEDFVTTLGMTLVAGRFLWRTFGTDPEAAYVLTESAVTRLGWPVAYYAMQRWLQNFAYRIELGPGPFLLAALLALVIAVLTVSGQAMKAALTNPVEALRYE
ncbi:MAG: ABC transporter permease [Candidatus Latescibacteria bacterium]|nr:ABC transporter permease [Candidatus Latescibacterota bacterium]